MITNTPLALDSSNGCLTNERRSLDSDGLYYYGDSAGNHNGVQYRLARAMNDRTIAFLSIALAWLGLVGIIFLTRLLKG